MQNDYIPFRSDLLPKISDLLNIYVKIFIINPKIITCFMRIIHPVIVNQIKCVKAH